MITDAVIKDLAEKETELFDTEKYYHQHLPYVKSLVSKFESLSSSLMKNPTVKQAIESLTSFDYFQELHIDFKFKTNIVNLIQQYFYMSAGYYIDNIQLNMSSTHAEFASHIQEHISEIQVDKSITYSLGRGENIVKISELVVRGSRNGNLLVEYEPSSLFETTYISNGMKQYYFKLFQSADLIWFPNMIPLTSKTIDYVDIMRNYLVEFIHNQLVEQCINLNKIHNTDLFTKISDPIENRDLFYTIKLIIHSNYSIQDYINYLIDIVNAWQKSTSSYVFEVQALTDFDLFDRLNKIYPVKNDDYYENLEIIVNYHTDYGMNKLIKPKNMMMFDFKRYLGVLNSIMKVRGRYHFISTNKFEFKHLDQITKSEFHHDIIYDIIRKFYSDRFNEFDFEIDKPVEEISYYKKIAFCEYSYIWNELLGTQIPQVAENFNPLYLGGKKKFEQYRLLYYNIKMLNDSYYSFTINETLALALTLLNIDVTKLEFVLHMESSIFIQVAKVASEYSLVLRYPSKENIRKFQRFMKYIKQLVFNQNIDSSFELNEYLGAVVEFVLKYDRFPNSIQELKQYILNVKYEDAPKELIEHFINLSISNVSKYSNYWKKYLETATYKTTLPSVDVSYKHYRFRFVDKKDPLQLFLGDYTDCCQVLNNAAESCVKYGMYSENSGFYVIEKNKKVYAQAWAWRVDNILVFDSFEAVTTDPSETVINLVKEVFDNILNNSNISEIRVGDCSFGITRAIINKLNMQPAETSVTLPDYNGYSDARKQVVHKTISK